MYNVLGRRGYIIVPNFSIFVIELSLKVILVSLLKYIKKTPRFMS